jgi:ankyrin repeat protein
MGEFTRTKLQQYHISWEVAHLLVARSCMCYISVCLKRGQGSAPANVSSCTGASKRTARLHPMSQPLLDYALDDALDHLGYLGSKFESALPDITALAEDIQQHSEIWDNVYLPARWGISTKPRWPAARHDLLLYVLVAFAPESFMSAFFRDNPLKPREGTNPLVYAAHFNKDEHARTLLYRGARLHDVGWETSRFRQSLPIDVAFQNRHYAMIIHFVEEGSTVPPHIFTDLFFKRNESSDALHYTPATPSSIAKVLVQTDDFAENMNSPLNEAAWRTIKISNQLMVFRDATERDLIPIIRRFVQVADEDFTYSSISGALFRFAVAQGSFSAVRYLLTLGTPTPLPSDLLITLHHYPGRWKTASMIRFLVHNGADVLARTSHRDSVLHAVLWAPGRNPYSTVDDADEDDILAVVKLLVGYGCDPLEADSWGNTPLQIAVERGHISVVRYLHTLGAPLPHDLLVTLKCGRTTGPMLRFLVENGANIHSHDSNGDSVLHVVLQSFHDNSGALEAVKLLVSYGCNSLEANSRGNTPLHIAVQRGHLSAAQYLLTLGAPLPPDLLATLEVYWLGQSMMHFLIENGVDVLQVTRAINGDSECLLHTVLQYRHDGNEALETVKLLVGCGCNPLEANSRGSTLLEIAVQRGYISVARYLLSLGAHLPPDLLVTWTRDSSCWSAAPIIRFLVENGVDVFANSTEGDSVLHVALQCFSDENVAFEAVRLLVGYGCDPLEADSRGNTPLHIAVERGYISVARYLLTLGARLPPDLLVTLNRNQPRWSTTSMIQFLVKNEVNVFAHSSDGDSVLHIVLRYFNDDAETLESVKVLVGCGCDPLEANSHGHTPLHIAVERGYISVARYLLTFGAPLPPDLLVTSKGHCYWAGRSTTPMIHFLVENGANVLARSSNGDSLLHIALQSLYDDNEAVETVKLLVGCGCNPLEANFRGDTPLHIVVRRGHISVARYLLTLGAPLPPDLLATLEVWLGQSMMHFLIENGLDVLARAANGDSSLHTLLQSLNLNDENEALEAVKCFVSYGCDPLEANSRGHTPLHIGVERGYISVARYFLTLGARLPPDILVKLDCGWQTSWNTSPMIRFLVETGADVLARTDDGDSVLHIALQCFSDENVAFETLKLLVGYGCDPLEVDSRGHTPLHIAVERGYISVVRYLLILGAPLPPDLLVTLDRHPSRWSTTPMLRFLVKNRVNVFAHSSDGDSVLHNVLRCFTDDKETLESVQLLVGYGCDPLEANSHGHTPLHIAVQRGRISVARYLLTLGASLPPDLLVTLKDHWGGRSTMIPFLVENGVDVLARASDGDSVLHIALQSLSHWHTDKALEIVKLLVGYGCDPLEANSRGNTPLHISVERGHLSAARYLLTLGARLPPDLPVTLNRDRQSRWSTTSMIHFLVGNGADVFAHGSEGDSLLHIALQCFYDDDKETLETAKVLVGYGCDPLEADSHGSTPLHVAVERGHISAARYLLTLGAPLPPDVLVTLNRDRSYWCTAPMIHFLVENGVNVHARTSDGDSVLHLALQCSNDDYRETLEAVKVLIGCGCDPLEANAHGSTPLHLAVQEGHISVARYLLTLGAPLPPDLLVTLDRDWSCWSSPPMIRFLVKNGVDVHAYASDGDSVLHIALRCFNEANDVLDAVKLLVSYGCNPLEPNSRGETPLHIAAERGNVSVARYLITQGASVLTKASNGDTMLHFATNSIYPYDEDDDGGALEAVKFFVRCGCELVATNDDGETPLHIAVDLWRIKTIMYLLSLNIPLPSDILFTAIESDDNSAYCRYIIATLVTSGCDTRTPNSDGDSPLRVAIMKGKVDVVEYLLSVVPVHNPPLEDLLSATALAPPSVQSEMRRILSDRRTRSESPDLPPTKRARFCES